MLDYLIRHDVVGRSAAEQNVTTQPRLRNSGQVMAGCNRADRTPRPKTAMSRCQRRDLLDLKPSQSRWSAGAMACAHRTLDVRAVTVWEML